uniref:USP domain-containing protein n=1 Tax=Xenopus tropicalis TaxID=8364 RepID=A0A1B8Y2G8_XENTR
MFGDLFEEDEDFSILPSSPNTNGKKSHPRDSKTPEPQGDTRLSGLRNQGGTCYLNSLLRTLFFTPEFREALFALGPKELGSLEEKDTPESQVRIIPLQLQRLFAQLLLLDQQALSTTDLTESFGWNSSECSLEGTSGHDLIKRLYHGTIVNCIQCKECGYISERQSAKLGKLPPFLTLSLLRFNFDFVVKCEHYKETSRHTFPTRLIIRPFCEQPAYPDLWIASSLSLTVLLIVPIWHNLEDSVYAYELFSVIIHKGGCYGGHSHAYIQDVDELGHWGLKVLGTLAGHGIASTSARPSFPRLLELWLGMRQSALQPVLPQALGTLAGHETALGTLAGHGIASASALPSQGSLNSGWAWDNQRISPSFPRLLALGLWLGSLNSGWAWDSQGFSPSFPRLLELWLGMRQSALQPPRLQPDLPPGSKNSGWAEDKSTLQPVLPQALGTLAGHGIAKASARPSPGSLNSGWVLGTLAGHGIASTSARPSFPRLLELWLGMRQSALQPVLPQALGTLAGHETVSTAARSLNSGWAWDSQGFSPSFPRLFELWLGMG